MAKTEVRESKTEAEAEERSFVRSWNEAIDQAGKDEKDWREASEKAVDIFRGKKSTGATRFNIFFANVETICPSVYNSTPTPDIRRRYNDEDEIGKQTAEVIERGLSYCVDMYDFDSVMKAMIRDGEITGRGIPRIRYTPIFAPVKDENGKPRIAEDNTPIEEVVDESVTTDYVPWRNFRRGPGFLWEHVPWVAFGDYLSKEDMTKLVGDEELLKEIPFNYSVGANGEYKKVEAKEKSIFKRAFVWQIWDRETRRVIYICPDFQKKALRVLDDPLGLTNFFPMPRPYQPVVTTDSLVPIVPYSIYEDLVLELNDLTARITKLVAQCRPRGLCIGNANDIAAIAEADDGELKPVQLVEAFVQGKGLDSMISWFPLDPTVKALVQLVSQREMVKQTIYEVTGIADIIRGSTNPSETLGAQQLKAQWGSVRIHDRQAEIQRVARELFRLKAEILATKFSPQKLQMMTGIQITPQILQVLQNDLMRNYRIDIETDSTIRGDMARNQEAMANFINGTAQYAAAVAPITEQMPDLALPFIEVYTAFARQFNLGKQAEDALDSIAVKVREAANQPKEPPPPTPEQLIAKQDADRNDALAKAEIEDKAARRAMDGDKMLADALGAGITPEMIALAKVSSQGVEQKLDAMAQALVKMGEMLVSVTKQVSAPRRTVITRGPDGRPIGAESVPVSQEQQPAPIMPGPQTIQ